MEFFAYIDVGTGSLFVQAIIGVVLSVVVVLRNFFIRGYYKIKSIFSRTNPPDEKK